MMNKTLNGSSLVQFGASSGMLDTKCWRCLDLYRLADGFNINWSKVVGGSVWFMEQLP